MNILDPVSSFEECIIPTPLAEIILDGESKGFHNEYTVRKLSLAVYNKQVNYSTIEIHFNNEKYVMNNTTGKIQIKNFMDLTYKLAFELMN